MPPSSQRPASTLTGAPSPQHRGPSVRPRPDPGQQETRLRTCTDTDTRTETDAEWPAGPGGGAPADHAPPRKWGRRPLPLPAGAPGAAGCCSRGALRPPPVSSPLCSNDFLRRLRRLRLHPGPGCRGSCDPADPEVTASLGKLARLPSACVPRPPLVPWALTHRTKTLKIIVTLPESQGVHPRPQGNRCHRRTFGPLFLPAEPLPLQRPVGYPEALPSHLGWWRTEDSRLRGAAQGAPPSPQAILRTPFCKAGRQGFQEPLHRYSHFQELRLEWAWGKAQRGQSGLLGVPCAV
ncbi:uncharacterized protein LOC106558633 isoform X1 [Canis lupus familiaris]|uniref:uncharacterized protein LOC106558633 isoform X1 n=1 Tax=Canis lupus familiaris TaxID=9615 RepID=UPI0018F3AC1D|nr:uncharacterized protein LOC106558633 isoform X1 [Canis lupus familiaris]